jgi:hypothetical protein
MWHPAQSLLVPAYLPPTWHFEHSTSACLPVSPKVEWLKLAGFHPAVVWQLWQFVGKPCAAWFGAIVELYVGMWHPAQSLLVPAYFPETWHLAHSTVACLPVRPNDVWLKLAGFHPTGVWQFWHDVGKPCVAWFGAVVAL